MRVSEAVPSAGSARSWGWWLAALALFALRLPHLGGPLDDPHSWRQCDTAFYSLDFARRGFDLLHPSVCWLGGHRTLIFEFPLPEAISGLLYRVFGRSETWDRLVGLAFFSIATLYLHLFVKRIATARAAWLTTLAWLALPLGQFYSRAAHVDFAATAGAHALLYHGARAARERRWDHAAGAAVGGALAALIKAPYLLPLLGPLGLLALSAEGLAGLALLGGALLVTVVAFKLWRSHVDAVNAAAPDWFFLPGYYKEVNPLWWYFGEWSQRLDRHSWAHVVRRLLGEVATPPGVLMAFASPLARVPAVRGFRLGMRGVTFAWCAGTFVYLLVFFPLNVIHNYYQIPFLAPAALLIALGAEAMLERVRPVALIALVLFFGMAIVTPFRVGYYRVDWLRVEAGRLIDSHVPQGELLIACDHASGYSDPRLLYRADRTGWSVAIPDLTPARVDALRKLGARHLAIVTSPEHPELASPAFASAARTDSLSIEHAGKRLGTLEIFDLGRLPAP
jgi:hypothetical protein